MSAAQEREAEERRNEVLVALAAPAMGHPARAATLARKLGPTVNSKSVGGKPMIEFILAKLAADGLAEQRSGWWRRTREGERHVRTLR
jgi:hypothetical protein